ncbi:Hypothetical predicted protein [Mytilus galloprovincialis]|uniref:Mab-21-like HhH/H2TH-like domain-containing protein n=1 Tax=Mytilus galloprovincialis TaxID=29158 RepID=A0A8B6EFM0_MYTGA|nr:Hypothetical predicted protein [Mytilus galloprovincialis]
MSSENSLSLEFYKYLCQKIGSEEEVRVRRLTYIINDLGIPHTSLNQITSGSKGEGLQLKGSDLDLMYIDPLYQVYESDREVVPESGRCIPLVMETEDTHPGFTQLRLPNNYDLSFGNDEKKNVFICRKLSSELYRVQNLEDFSKNVRAANIYILKIHGPCISTVTESIDFVNCLKSDQWISQAQPWITRPRTTWPSPDLISRIISCGVLFVPIGCQGSCNEILQWRMSFSVAEKVLIFSFTHVQLLCYALLKLLVKEIVEKNDELKRLLCSYFLKTLMFWISEELNPSIWSPDKIIVCFMACLKKLIYCVEYSTLLHYFIPDNNLFYLRFDVDKKDKVTSILKNLFEKGIYCFARSETLSDIIGLPLTATDSAISRRVATLHNIISTAFTLFLNRPLNLLYHFLHHASTIISKSIFFEMLTVAHQIVPQISQHQPRSNNKHKYYKYKQDLSHLLIGTNSDAVAGWLVLASFFYVHDNYLLSLDIINHALRKCTHEKVYPWQIGLDQNQEYLLFLLKQTKLCTLSKVITIKNPKLIFNSSISPQELQLSVREQYIPFHPIIFAHFLSFLCYYHLHKIRSCKQSLLQLRQEIVKHFTTNRSNLYFGPLFVTCLGIAHQMIGETDSARQCFLQATQKDKLNLTNASIRLSNMDQI